LIEVKPQLPVKTKAVDMQKRSVGAEYLQRLKLHDHKTKEDKMKNMQGLSAMPYDMLRFVFDFLSTQEFRQLRVNREFNRLLNKKRTGLEFIHRDIHPDMFKRLISKNSHINKIKIRVPLQYIGLAFFRKFHPVLPNLTEIDFMAHKGIADSTLNQIIGRSKDTLKCLKINYASKAVTSDGIFQLKNCHQLSRLILANPEEHLKEFDNQKLGAVKRFLGAKRKKPLIQLELYEADEQVLELLVNNPDQAKNLQALTIVKFIQKK